MKQSIVTCELCNEIINSIAVTTGGTMASVFAPSENQSGLTMPAAWHPRCFRCSNCKVHLFGQTFQIKGPNSPFCVRCGDLMYTRRCAGCAKALKTSGKILNALDAFWHARCFRCVLCRGSLTHVWYKEPKKGSMPICKSCALRSRGKDDRRRRRIDRIELKTTNDDVDRNDKDGRSGTIGKRDRQDTNELGFALDFCDLKTTENEPNKSVPKCGTASWTDVQEKRGKGDCPQTGEKSIPDPNKINDNVKDAVPESKVTLSMADMMKNSVSSSNTSALNQNGSNVNKCFMEEKQKKLKER